MLWADQSMLLRKVLTGSTGENEGQSHRHGIRRWAPPEASSIKDLSSGLSAQCVIRDVLLHGIQLLPEFFHLRFQQIAERENPE